MPYYLLLQFNPMVPWATTPLSNAATSLEQMAIRIAAFFPIPAHTIGQMCLTIQCISLYNSFCSSLFATRNPAFRPEATNSYVES
ncbi:hypothetical protein WK41_38605 [Burkholderia cepacia]|nr:hypothetical protein WK41_38605 [Burkholderia cepacia]